MDLRFKVGDKVKLNLVALKGEVMRDCYLKPGGCQITETFPDRPVGDFLYRIWAIGEPASTSLVFREEELLPHETNEGF